MGTESWGSFGATVGDPETDSDATSTTGAGSTTDDPQCGVHPTCGELRCFSGRCHGCKTWEDCPSGEVCWRDDCIDPQDAPRCLGVEAPVCGDGVIGALEECDGGRDCASCETKSAPLYWWSYDATSIERTIASPDGGSFAVQSGALRRFASDGGLHWTVTYPQTGSAIAVDAQGVVYIAGGNIIPIAETKGPWLASWTPDGTQRWSNESVEPGRYACVDADTSRVVVGGVAPQSNTPQKRGFVAQYDSHGALMWSTKIVTTNAVTDIALAGTQTLALASAVDPWWARQLLRFDETGVLVQTVELSTVDDYIEHASGLVHDGAGGSWIWGRHQGGPVVVHYDEQGRETERLECLGRTTGELTHLAVGPSGELAV
ncbi:MAG: hypothetical protein JKY37_21640, partial [Nannocystaceae bacterium]|nr:hypothetical protein [Nannocystaceae bacterium]